MERQLNKINYLGKIIRPLAACVLVLSSTYITPEVHATKFRTSPIVQAESYNPRSFQKDFLPKRYIIENIQEDEEIEEKSAVDLRTFRLTDRVIRGTAGHYSREGCVGCSEGMIMSNGEPLDDDKLTLAAPLEIPLNSQVLITNTVNNKSVIATVADRGGFKTLDRIADLTPAVKTAIGGESDLMDVEITVLESIDSTPNNP